VDQQVVVTVEATVTPTQNALLNSITLVRYSQSDQFEANLGPMFDDGTHGDRVANDNIFTTQVTIQESTSKNILFRASLAFRRQLKRTLSPSATFTITPSLPLQVQITRPTNGAIFKTQPITVEGTVANATSQTVVAVNGVNAVLANGQFKADVPLAREGIHTITAIALNSGGGASQASVDIVFDSLPPTLAIDSPANGANLFSSPATINGRVLDTGSGLANVTCKGAAATLNGQNFSCNVALTPGANTINIVATDVAGNASTAALSLTYTTVPTITLTSPTNLSFLNITPTTVTGKVDDPTAKVTVNSVEAAVVNGNFSVALPLLEGPNTITASATSSNGAVGTASLVVTLDTTPPRVTITSPANQFVTTEASISIAGSVNDIVVGTVNAQQAQVTVNGVAAQVANRTFLAPNIPLQMGNNVIQAIGRDRTGNTTTTQITVIRQPATQAQIRALAGNNQTAAIGSLLPAPLVVVVTDASGNPVPNKQVIFKATQNDGMVSTNGTFAPTVIATTNAQGQAQVQWKLGMRAGAGGNCVEAYVVGFMGTAIFSATGTQGPAGKIVIDTGNDQIGNINQPLPKPLIAVVVDEGNNRLANVPVTFTIKEGGGNFGGQATFTVNSDSDGRVAANLTLGLQEGNANNLVEANFATNTGFPASFTASGRAPGNPTNTTISGVVLDNSNVPIPGVTIRAVLTNLLTSNSNIIQSLPAVQTNAQGQFTIPQAPVGFVKLLVDGSTATRPGKYPTLDYDLVTVAGQNNRLSMPVFLLPLNTSNQLCVTETTGGGTLTVPEAPGFSLTFGPGQVIFPGGSKTGCISVTVVHSDKVPMSPGFGQQPRFIVTIQPSGAVFTIPATITLPNVDGLRPRAVTEMYSFDHDIGSFVAIGTATVSEDGLVIRSNPGVGVLKAGWHCGGDPAANGTVADCPDCKICRGNNCVADSAQNGTNPNDSNTCCFEGERLDKFGQTVGIIFDGPLEKKCPKRTQNTSRLHIVDGCSNPVTTTYKDDPMQILAGVYPFGLLNQAPTAFGKDLGGTVPNASAAGPEPCNQHDICYQTCTPPGTDLSASRQVCDDGMKTRMDNVCSAAYPSTCPSTLSIAQCVSYFLQRVDCFTYSGAYWTALRGFGFFAYKERQEQYCQCCP
jgi:hypothetical protein